jgi:Uma2 family endonuclease
VSCEHRDLGPRAPTDYLQYPSVVVEVPSPTTESTDRREKSSAYRRLDSLQAGVLVDQDVAAEP